jgi:hypothetical protein
MKLIKTAFVAVFVVFTLNLAVRAAELNTLKADDVRALTSDLAVPAPELSIEEPANSEAAQEDAAAASAQQAHSSIRALDEALATKNGLDPVVITISGLRFGEIGVGPFELKKLIKFFRFFFHNKNITEAEIVNGVVSFNPRYFFPEEDPDARELSQDRVLRLEDNYLEAKLREIPGYDQHDVIIVPFAWSRDPKDTRETLPRLQQKIADVYDQYKGTGRPIYILAHSWGSVMVHTALHRVYLQRPDVRIDKLITAGSPLVPANLVVRMFVKLEKMSEGLEKRVSKPANVAVWRNIWAMRDAYSNAIAAADSNYQADAQVENLEPTLIQLIIHKKILRKLARQDLFKMRDIKAWHGAYFFDYKAELNSIHKEIFVPVFRPLLAPQVVDCSVSPRPVCVN